MQFVTEMVDDSYIFSDDGTFVYFPYSERFAYYNGTYSASNGRLYLANVARRNIETDEKLTNKTVSENIVLEYAILRDDGGEYLSIGSLEKHRTQSSIDISQADKYYAKNLP